MPTADCSSNKVIGLFVALYDMRLDPFQLHNIYNTTAAAPLHAQLHADLATLWGCVGNACP